MEFCCYSVCSRKHVDLYLQITVQKKDIQIKDIEFRPIGLREERKLRAFNKKKIDDDIWASER
jgi:hypothetical protein